MRTLTSRAGEMSKRRRLAQHGRSSRPSSFTRKPHLSPTHLADRQLVCGGSARDPDDVDAHSPVVGVARDCGTVHGVQRTAAHMAVVEGSQVRRLAQCKQVDAAAVSVRSRMRKQSRAAIVPC
jgi:hypothetical protein